MKDLFAAPTDDELSSASNDLFAAPTPEEIGAPKEESFGKRFARNTIDTLPAIGAFGAGALATPESGGIATIPAAAAGYAGGKQLARILKSYLLGDEMKSNGDTVPEKLGNIAKQTGKDLGEGAAFEMAGQSIGAIPGAIKSGVKSASNYAQDFISDKLGPNVDYTPIANKDEVEAAAQKLGIDNVPKGVLTDNPTYQKLESGLSQSGSFPAKDIRDQYSNFFKGVDNASSKISDLRTPDSDFAIGGAIQKDLTDQVNASREPVTELYKGVAPDLKNIPVNQSVVNKVFGNLKKQPIFQTEQGKAFLAEHKDIIANTPDLGTLKEIRSGLNDLVNGASLPVEANRVSALRQAVTSVRDNSIEALKAELPKEVHGEIDDLIQQISLADSAHASNVNDINSIKGIVGNKDINSPTTFLNKISDSKESDIAQKASNLDISSLRNLQSKYPSVFEKAKAAKINDMIQSSTSPVNGFNETAFMKKYDGLDGELKDLIFTPEIQSHIDSLKTLKQAIPDKLGPSGTPEGQMMMDMFNPKRNALDYGIKKALELKAAPTPEISLPPEAVEPSKVTPILQMLRGNQDSNEGANNSPNKLSQTMMKSPQMAALAEKNPQVFNMLAQKMSDKISSKANDQESNKPYSENQLMQKTQGTKYAQVLQNASKRGQKAVGAANFILQSKDPEYRKLTLGDEDENEDQYK